MQRYLWQNFCPDHLGTSTALTDFNGVAYQFFLNLPFGETMFEQLGSNYFQSPYKFNGKELDDETGFYYYGARYYDPRISVWLSVDPLAEKMPSWSPYSYCFNSPVSFVDPDGAFPEPWLIKIFENKWGKANSIKFSSAIYSQMNKSWNQSFDKFRTSTERGATLTINRAKKEFEFVNIGGNRSTSATFNPDINIDKNQNILIGTFHTHPYGKNDGAWDGAFIPFSDGDFATMDDFDEAVSLNQSGKNVYALVMTSKTPSNLDSAEAFYQTEFDTEYSKQIENGLTAKNSAEKAGEKAVRKTAKQYHMMYFKGENSKHLVKHKL